MLSATMRRWDEAEAHYRVALAMNQRQNARPALAQARHGYAQMLLARDAPGDREAALGQLDEAATETAALQMRALSARVDAMRAGIGTVSVVHYPAGLSGREAQVLRLVAAGKGNRQIASELFVSPNTVANHVRSILSKTRSANRTEAAAFAIHHDLLKEVDHRSQ
jgi:DNA-binding NarL/FixJ family response regulator